MTFPVRGVPVTYLYHRTTTHRSAARSLPKYHPQNTMYNVMVLVNRKAGVSQEEFKQRYERHMQMVKGLCGDTTPVSHTRWYHRTEGTGDQAAVLVGNAEPTIPSAVVIMEFEDKAAFERFSSVLATGQAKKKIEADEAGFWDREAMQILMVDVCRTWGS